MVHAVELEGVTKRFGSQVAVDGLNLTVPEGVVYGFSTTLMQSSCLFRNRS
jgi:ABC-type multidrug transport system ATPase subunit